MTPVHTAAQAVRGRIAPDQELRYLLPLPGHPQAVFQTSVNYDGGSLVLDGRTVLEAHTRAELESGVSAHLPSDRSRITVRLMTGSRRTLQIDVEGRRAVPVDEIRVPPSASAWLHGWLALAGSAAGFVASYLYLRKAAGIQDEWALKMGTHMAGWHLLLTFTLFPASVWGQRVGIRAVQVVSLLFFCIHAGIACANLGPSDPTYPLDRWIALFNATSGAFFLMTTVFGNRAHRDMDPVAALRGGRSTNRTDP